MSIFSNVTEEDLINLRKLAEQQKNQRALKNNKGISKQTHDVKLAECLSPITKNLSDVSESTQKIGELMIESISENENNKQIVNDEIKIFTLSILLQETLYF